MIDPDLAPVVLNESKAILLHLARKYGLYGKNEVETCLIDQFHFWVEDVRMTFNTMSYQSDFDEKKDAFAANLVERLTPMEKWLESRNLDKEWSASESISYADFFAYETLASLLQLKPDLFDQLPKCGVLFKKVESLPQIAAYKVKYLKSNLFHIILFLI